MRTASLLLLVPIFAQCQCEVDALRSEAFVPFAGKMQVWHNPGYTTDVLWFPDYGVKCVALRELDSTNQPTGRWFVGAYSATAAPSEPTEAVKVPGALAARIVGLASASGRQGQEERDLAEAAFAAGLFRDISEFKRVLRSSLAPPSRLSTDDSSLVIRRRPAGVGHGHLVGY